MEREPRNLSVLTMASESVATYLLPRALEALRKRRPRIRASVSVGTVPAIKRAVAEGDCDVGLFLEAGGNKDQAEIRPLAHVALVLFCRSGHPLASTKRGPISLADLEPFPVFSSDASGDFHDLLVRFFSIESVLRVRLEAASSIVAVKRTILTGAGYLGVLPAFAISEELRDRVVTTVALRNDLPSVSLRGILRPEPRPPAAAELVTILRASLAPRPSVAGRVRPAGPRGA